MSGPKESRPIFVSNAERRRIALEAARRDAQAAAERLAKAMADAPAAARKQVKEASAGSVRDLRRFVSEADAAIKAIAGRTRLVEALNELAAADRGAASGVQLSGPAPVQRAVTDERAVRMRKIEQMLAQVPGDVSGLVAIGKAWSAEADAHRRERLHSELLSAIRSHQAGIAAAAKARAEADTLLGQIDGIEGEQAAAFRAELNAAAAKGAIPDALREKAKALDTGDNKRHVDAVVSRVLDEQGADQGGFATAFEKPGKLIQLDGIADAFALVLVQEDGTVRFEPVRLPTCAATDREIQDAYHAVLERVSASAADEGVDIQPTRVSLREPPVRQISLGDTSERRAEATELKAKTFGGEA